MRENVVGLIEIFEEQYNALGRVPTGIKVSLALWHELSKANQIVPVQAQINYRGLQVPIEETLPTYKGKSILHFDHELGDKVDFEFSPK